MIEEIKFDITKSVTFPLEQERDIPFRTDIFPGRRERSERDLLFDDDNGRKKGKTQSAYDEYADLYSMFEHLKNSTRKRDQYVNVTTTKSITVNGKPDFAEKKQVAWIQNVIQNLKKSKKDELESVKRLLQNEKKELEVNKKDTTEVEKRIKSLDKQIYATTPEKEKEIVEEIAQYKALETEKIDLWMQMETIIEKLSQNEYVKSRFLNFRYMNERMYKDGLYDLILD